MKRILIHLGPAKTGTSAIQHWLAVNNEVLTQQGIYYPSHKLDKNGVSSGNLYAIYDKCADTGQPVFNPNKASKLLTKFRASDFCTLLLSSEFFFDDAKLLAQHLPDAEFILYLRNPLDVAESGFSQSVKRHFRTQPFRVGKLQLFKQFNDLLHVVTWAQKTHVRLYDLARHEAGGIIGDFARLLGINSDIENKKVNGAYAPEALEFKRWLNHYPIADLNENLDKALQQYSQGCQSVRLIRMLERKEFLQEYKQKLTEHAETLGIQPEVVNVIAAQDMPANEDFESPPLCDDKIRQIITFLNQHAKQESKMLRHILEQHGRPEFKPFEDICHANLLPSSLAQRIGWVLKHKAKALLTPYRQKHVVKQAPFRQQVFGLADFKQRLGLQNQVDDAVLIRELALLMEKNAQIGNALSLMELAHKLRPNGRAIEQKLREYKHKLNKAQT